MRERVLIRHRLDLGVREVGRKRSGGGGGREREREEKKCVSVFISECVFVVCVCLPLSLSPPTREQAKEIFQRLRFD